MQIFVKTLNGNIITLAVEASNTIDGVKAQTQSKELFPSNQQHLTFKGNQLKGGHTVSEYNIQESDTVRLACCGRSRSRSRTPSNRSHTPP
jgi:hypothetical protein